MSHQRGASWIRENGVDRNLGNHGAERRVSNNTPKDVLELEMEEAEVEVVLVEMSKSNPDIHIDGKRQA